jgi:hypothetical protein
VLRAEFRLKLNLLPWVKKIAVGQGFFGMAENVLIKPDVVQDRQPVAWIIKIFPVDAQALE